MLIILLGVLLALCAAFAESGVDVLRKKNAKVYDAITASWALHSSTFVVLLPILIALIFADQQVLGTAPTIPTSFTFWRAIGLSLLPNIVATYLYMRALEKADISLALPLVTLSSPFLLATAFLINSEIPSWIGITGVFVTTLGTYGLKYAKGQKSWIEPFRRLLKDKASLMMLGVAFLYALSSPWDKQAALSGGPLWTTLFLNGALAVVFTPLMFAKQRWSRIGNARAFKWLLSFGLADAVRSVCQFGALMILLTPYAIGLKRLSVIFGILWGRWLFKEKQTGQRAIAAALMLAGSFLILLATLKQ